MRQLQQWWDITAGDSLDRMTARQFTGKHRGLGGLHREDLHRGICAPKSLAASGESAASPVAGYEGVDASVGDLRENFGDGRRLVVVRVDCVLELAREKVARIRSCHLAAEFYAGSVAIGRLEELDLTTEVRDQVPALDTRRVAHQDLHTVPFHRADHRERDARVAARALEDHRVATEQATPLGILDEAEREPVLDRAARIQELGLREDCDAFGLELEPQEWRVSD
jgi:hypothetical protein